MMDLIREMLSLLKVIMYSPCKVTVNHLVDCIFYSLLNRPYLIIIGKCMIKNQDYYAG